MAIKTTDLTSEQVLQQKANKIFEQNNKMGKDQFLNLLMTQLKTQDPLKPMDDTQFIAQMAQFSSLEQMQQLTSSFSQVKSVSMVGKYVEGTYTNETTGEKMTVTGNVDGTKYKDSKVYLSVNGKDVLIDDVDYVGEDQAAYDLQSNLQTAKNYVGKSITIKDANFTGTISDAKIQNKTVIVTLTSGNQKVDVDWNKISSILMPNKSDSTSA